MAAVENAVPAVSSESKSARKKKVKAAEAAAAAAVNGTKHTAPTVPSPTAKDDSNSPDADSSGDHPYLKELQKQIRSVNKKLSAMHKLDAIIAEHPGVSLKDLVAQRKINPDQKAAAEKKPQLQAQLADLEERQEQYRKLDSDYQLKFTKQREELTQHHQQEVERIRQELRVETTSASPTELKKKLLVFSQFLRAAAAKRTVEDEADTDESRAFEGVLLLMYGGDQKAVETAVNLIEGSDEQAPGIDGVPIPFTYEQVKKAAIEHAPFQTEEAWVDQVAEATGGETLSAKPDVAPAVSDPTIAHAGLTEIDAQPNGIPIDAPEPSVAPVSAGDAGNLASERWDTDATGAGGEKNGMDESYEMIARPSEEVDIPADTTVSSAPQPQGTSWADEPTNEAATGVGNQAGEAWDMKVPGEQTDNNWSAEPASNNGWAETSTEAAAADDGFSEVPGRSRGRGGNRGRGSDGEFRGRGGRRGNFRGRGDGEFRGRGNHRGGRGDGEFRGGRGRGRGPRGGSDPATARP